MAVRLGDWHCYAGAIHIHTTESDGTKTLEEVVSLGREVGLDFMMFSDHMTLSNREMGKEGFYGDTLVTVGYEHNDADDIHHYLLFDSPRVYPSDMSAAEYVKAGAADGALGFLAHPDEIRNKLKSYPPYPWKDWSVDGFTGIELWNQMSEWMEKLTRYNMLVNACSPRKWMVGPTDRILKKWDELNMTRKVVGFASVDAHAFSAKVGPLKVEIFPYKVHFKTLRSYILLPEEMSRDFNTARDQLYQALRDCRLYFANVRWGAADEFEFYIKSGDQTTVSGGQIKASADARLVVNLPERATLKLIHNGQYTLQANTDRLELDRLDPGLYRVEAWKGKRGWIFSNHIRVESE